MTFSALKGSLNASRETLSQTLDDLCTNGVVARPSVRRGPYSLTVAGTMVGETCGGAVEVVLRVEALQIALKKWPMLVLTAAGRGGRRYGELAGMLPGVTPRALAGALKDLEGAELVSRTVIPGAGRSAAYELTPRGQVMFPALDALVSACDDAMEALLRAEPGVHPPK